MEWLSWQTETTLLTRFALESDDDGGDGGERKAMNVCVTEVVFETTNWRTGLLRRLVGQSGGRLWRAQRFGLCLTNMTAGKGHANRPLYRAASIAELCEHSGMH